MKTTAASVALGLLVAAPLLFVDCLEHRGDSENIALLVALFLVSLPWNLVALFAIGAIYDWWPKEFNQFYGFVWEVTACHEGRAPSLEWSAIWYSYIIGTFANTQVICWLVVRKRRQPKVRVMSDGT